MKQMRYPHPASEYIQKNRCTAAFLLTFLDVCVQFRKHWRMHWVLFGFHLKHSRPDITLVSMSNRTCNFQTQRRIILWFKQYELPKDASPNINELYEWRYFYPWLHCGTELVVQKKSDYERISIVLDYYWYSWCTIFHQDYLQKRVISRTYQQRLKT